MYNMTYNGFKILAWPEQGHMDWPINGAYYCSLNAKGCLRVYHVVSGVYNIVGESWQVKEGSEVLYTFQDGFLYVITRDPDSDEWFPILEIGVS